MKLLELSSLCVRSDVGPLLGDGLVCGVFATCLGISNEHHISGLLQVSAPIDRPLPSAPPTPPPPSSPRPTTRWRT